MVEQALRLPSDVEAVIARWNPAGIERLRKLENLPSGGRTVAVLGHEATAVQDELSAVAADIDFANSRDEAALVVLGLDATAPIGRSTLRHVESVILLGTRVVFAIEGIEANRDWRSVRNRNSELLAPHGKRILPVSVRLAQWARTRPDVRGQVRANSGMLELRDVVAAELVTDPDRVRTEQLLRATEGTAEETRRRIAAKAESLRPATEVAALRNERSALVSRRDGGRAEAMAALRSQVQLARVELLHEVANRVRSVNITARQAIDRADRTQLRAFPRTVEDTVAALTGDIDEQTHRRIAEIRAKVLGHEGFSVGAAIGGPQPQLGEGPTSRVRGVEDRLMIVLGASAGVGISRLAVTPLSLVPALDYATIPVTLVLGGLGAWWITRSRGQVADRAHLRQWTADALVSVRSQLEQRVIGALVAAEGAVADHVVRVSAERMVAVDAEISAIDAKMRQANARNAGQLAACERDLDTIARGLAQLPNSDL